MGHEGSSSKLLGTHGCWRRCLQGPPSLAPTKRVSLGRDKGRCTETHKHGASINQADMLSLVLPSNLLLVPAACTKCYAVATASRLQQFPLHPRPLMPTQSACMLSKSRQVGQQPAYVACRVPKPGQEVARPCDSDAVTLKLT